MIKQIKGYKSFWMGSNKIGITVSYPSGKYLNLVIDLDEFTVDEFSNQQIGTDLADKLKDVPVAKVDEEAVTHD